VLTDPAKSLETRPAARPITIRDLMTHTSGLNYGLGEKSPAITAMLQEGITPYQLTRAMEQDMRPTRPKTLAEFAERIGTVPLAADPGTKFIYSQGLDVLAAVVERASGMPYESFLRTRLLKPLGMNSTYWQVPRDQAGRLVTNYGSGLLLAAFGGKPEKGDFLPLDPGATSVYLDPPSFPYGGAGLVSTAGDYDRFLHMLLDDGQLDGVRILSPETARLARSNLFPAGVSLKGFGPISTGDQAGFGAGGYVTLSKVDGYGRGQGTYGWDGAAGTRAWVDPVRRVRAVMMINTFSPNDLGPRFDKAVAADLGSAPAR
jgi:CubicO group peptidase (beta-lactamase class C family)